MRGEFTTKNWRGLSEGQRLNRKKVEIVERRAERKRAYEGLVTQSWSLGKEKERSRECRDRLRKRVATGNKRETRKIKGRNTAKGKRKDAEKNSAEISSAKPTARLTFQPTFTRIFSSDFDFCSNYNAMGVISVQRS